ncbi:MAG: transketolase [Candidatus Hydrogenedentota bacterium]|nr:MAG: transketolase [Candidatus Hydrogenedentota bacterium]
MSEKTVDVKKLEQIAHRTRINVVKMIAKSGIGHLGGSVSIAEILAVLYFHELRIDPKNPEWEDRDRFVLSKGHGCPALYATFAEVGYISKDVLPTLHQVDSILQMHPERGLCPGIEMSTGALGQGLSAAVGMALGAKIKEKDFRVYALLGCGECNEGQIWEAAMAASKFDLDNLVAIIDYNKFALSGRTQEVMPLEPLYDKWVAFGWHVIEANGHSVTQLINALEEAREVKGKPTFIIAHTVKGRNISYVEDTWPSHSVQMTTEQVEGTLEELGCSKEEIKTTLAQMKEKK